MLTDSNKIWELEVKWLSLSVKNAKNMLEIFSQAFSDHHFLIRSNNIDSNTTYNIFKAFIDFFSNIPEALILGGIKNPENQLVCASFSKHSDIKPSVRALIPFIFRICRTIGWRRSKELSKVEKYRPNYTNPYIELIILGTLPKYQKRGLGHCMISALAEKARNNKFSGIILIADKDTPSFDFYQKENFKVDKEVTIGDLTACWMRLEI